MGEERVREKKRGGEMFPSLDGISHFFVYSILLGLVLFFSRASGRQFLRCRPWAVHHLLARLISPYPLLSVEAFLPHPTRFTPTASITIPMPVNNNALLLTDEYHFRVLQLLTTPIHYLIYQVQFPCPHSPDLFPPLTYPNRAALSPSSLSSQSTLPMSFMRKVKGVGSLWGFP